MGDMLRTGRLDRASALLQLQDLRDVLGLQEQDHHDALQVLSLEDASLLSLDARDLQKRDLRLEAAREELQELMAIIGVEALDLGLLSSGLRQKLDNLRRHSGLEEKDWNSLLLELAPGGLNAVRALSSTLERRNREAGLLLVLEKQAVEYSLLYPLVMVMRRRLNAMEVALRRGLPQQPLPNMQPSGTVEEALEMLWLDPDPDVAAWVVMVERRLKLQCRFHADVAERVGLQSSPFLDEQLSGVSSDRMTILECLTATRLFEDLMPDQLLWLAGHVRLQSWPEGAIVMRADDPSHQFLVVVKGSGEVLLPSGLRVAIGSGETIGEMGVISARPRSQTVLAGAHGLQALVVPAPIFEELLRASTDFSRDLLGLLAGRIRLMSHRSVSDPAD